MNKPKVYLAGPISGLLYKDCVAWRTKAIKELAKSGIIGVSPIKPEARLEKEKRPMNKFGYQKDPLNSARGLTVKDRFYCTKADMLLVNLLGAKCVSIGTVMEIAWADSARIPTVVVMEPNGNFHDHAMLNECTGYRVTTLEEALKIIKLILEH